MSNVHSKVKTGVIAGSAVIGIALVVAAGLGFWDYFKITHIGIDVPLPSSVVTDTKEVSEKPVTVTDKAYIVPADQPRIIEIPKLDITAYIQKVGIDTGGAMSTPNNIHFAAWYVKSVTPGDAGVSIMNGHAGGRYSEGIFRNIGSLDPDDIIRIQMGDMSWRRFSVVSSTTYNVTESVMPLFHDDPSIKEELHLITCDGILDDHSQSYDKRTIVVAKYEL